MGSMLGYLGAGWARVTLKTLDARRRIETMNKNEDFRDMLLFYTMAGTCKGHCLGK